jgi:large conductance mechanosensitive channel
MPKEDKMLEELRRIRELLEPKPAPPPPKGLWNEFMDFISKYKVMGLAVAFILGIYLGALVQALVTSLIMPVITLLLPPDLSLDVQVGPAIFKVGSFIDALITFLIVALVIFILVKIAKKWGIE